MPALLFSMSNVLFYYSCNFEWHLIANLGCFYIGREESCTAFVKRAFFGTIYATPNTFCPCMNFVHEFEANR